MLQPILTHRTTPPRLQISSSPARLRIENQRASQQIDSPAGRLSITTEAGRLSIDGTRGRESLGYHTLLNLSADLVGYALRQYNRGVASIVAEGNRMAQIESGGNAIASISRDRMFTDMNDRQFVISAVPLPPEIRYTAGRVNLSYQRNAPRVQITAQRPVISVEPSRVRIDVTPPALDFALKQPAGALDVVA